MKRRICGIWFIVLTVNYNSLAQNSAPMLIGKWNTDTNPYTISPGDTLDLIKKEYNNLHFKKNGNVLYHVLGIGIESGKTSYYWQKAGKWYKDENGALSLFIRGNKETFPLAKLKGRDQRYLVSSAN